MQPWILLAEADAPKGGRLRLLRRGDEFSIRLKAGNELMSSRLGGSEEALARLALERVHAPTPHVLIGGLGMGFTLRAVQDLVGPEARVTTAEIVPELVDWARTLLSPVFEGCLDDPRSQIAIEDVGALIARGRTDYDAILLDVDNGPDGVTRPGNDALYGEAGLLAARRALRPGGVLAVWSATKDEAFTRRLAACGFRTEAHIVRAGRTGRGMRHVVWTAVKA